MLKKCKHKKILYEKIDGFRGVCSKTQDMSSIEYLYIPPRNTIIKSYCVDCGKQLKTYEWNDYKVKVNIK